METKFTYSPDLGAKLTEQPFVQVTKFGDGYEVRTPYLINTRPKNWALTFTSQLERHKEILNFLREHNAVYTFEWVDPEGEQAKWICRNWESAQEEFGVYKIMATFEQVFE